MPVQNGEFAVSPRQGEGRCDLVAAVDPNVSPFVGSRERVQDSDAGRLVVGHIARDDGKTVHQRRRCDLLVQRILGMWHAQPSPYLRDLLVEWEDRVSVVTCDRAEPTRQASRLREVATMAHGFNALAQLADRDRREEQRDTLCVAASRKNRRTPGLARVRFRALLMTSVSTKVHRPFVTPAGRSGGARSRRLRRRRASPRVPQPASGAWGATTLARGFPDAPVRRCDCAGRRAS